jgi:hypothetical protein
MHDQKLVRHKDRTLSAFKICKYSEATYGVFIPGKLKVTINWSLMNP